MATSTNKPAAAPPAKADDKPAEQNDGAPKIPAGENPMAERQIRRAYLLEHQRGELLDQINSNRELLRLMAETEELSEAQEDWLDTFYPSREEGVTRSTEEVEATRKLREAARKKKVA